MSLLGSTAAQALALMLAAVAGSPDPSGRLLPVGMTRTLACASYPSLPAQKACETSRLDQLRARIMYIVRKTAR